MNLIFNAEKSIVAIVEPLATIIKFQGGCRSTFVLDISVPHLKNRTQSAGCWRGGGGVGAGLWVRGTGWGTGVDRGDWVGNWGGGGGD